MKTGTLAAFFQMPDSLLEELVEAAEDLADATGAKLCALWNGKQWLETSQVDN